MGETERDGGQERRDEDKGRPSGGKVRAVTEVEIEQEGRGNSIALYRDKDGAWRELLGSLLMIHAF